MYYELQTELLRQRHREKQQLGYSARVGWVVFQRAAYWRALGFPNCALATAARMEKRCPRLELCMLDTLE